MSEIRVNQEHVQDMAKLIWDLLTDHVAGLVRTYFSNDRYAGAAFNVLGNNDPYSLTPDDLLAARFLSVDIEPPAIRALLLDEGISEQVTALLMAIDPRVRLWDSAAVDALVPSDELWNLLKGVRGIDWVIAGKLLARKRPHLIPIADSLVWEYFQPLKGQFWETLRQVLQDAELRKRIEDTLRPDTLQSVEMMDKVSTIRLLDVAVWMHMKNPQ